MDLVLVFLTLTTNGNVCFERDKKCLSHVRQLLYVAVVWRLSSELESAAGGPASGTDLECIISSVPVPMVQRPSACRRASATRGLQMIEFTGVPVRMCRPVTMEEAV
jgi:hypothetical protein